MFAPDLRFPEFSEEWKQYKVCDVLDFYSTNSLSWEQLDYGEQTLLNLHYGLIHVGLPTLVNLKKETLPGVKKGYVPSHYEPCKSGDVAFADASEDTNDVGKAIEFIDTDNKNVVCGLHTIHGRDNKGITVNGFKGYAFASIAFHHQIRRIAQGTKIFSISTKNFSECSIGIPSKNEQEKIAKLLSLVDERLITQSRAIEDLKQLRLALYQRVFTNLQGDSVSLKSVADVIKGNQINGDELSENGKYYVMNGGVLPSGYYDEFNTPANTISISEGGNSCGYVQFNEEPFWSGGHCYTLQVCKTINVRYLFHYLKYKEQDIMKLRIGSGLPNIQKKDLEHFMVVIPNTNKQQKLTSLFDCIQIKENIEKALLSQWQIQKRYLLQKMFI